MRKKLTTKTVESLQAAPTGRYEVWDILLAGFGVRITENGRKSWVVIGRVNGRQLRHTIGTFPALSLQEAREVARGIIGTMQLGTYVPIKQAEAAAPTLSAAITDFIERYAKPKNRRWTAAQSDLRKFTGIANVELGKISRADIVKELDRIAANGAPVGVNRCLAQIKKLYAWALDRGMVTAHPALGLKKPAKETSRDRILTDAECVRFWGTAERMGFPFGPLLKLLLLTGQRRGEVGGMRWSQIDFDRAIWKIPADVAKNGRAHEVPLSTLVVEIIQSLPRFDGSDFLFTTTGRSPVSGFGRVKERLDQAVGFSDWRLHDLRRTAASGMARLAISPHVIEKVLNHVSGTISGIAAVYNRHGYESEKRQALDSWATFVAALEPSNVAGKPGACFDAVEFERTIVTKGNSRPRGKGDVRPRLGINRTGPTASCPDQRGEEGALYNPSVP